MKEVNEILAAHPVFCATLWEGLNAPDLWPCKIILWGPVRQDPMPNPLHHVSRRELRTRLTSRSSRPSKDRKPIRTVETSQAQPTLTGLADPNPTVVYNCRQPPSEGISAILLRHPQPNDVHSHVPSQHAVTPHKNLWGPARCDILRPRRSQPVERPTIPEIPSWSPVLLASAASSSKQEVHNC